MIINVRIIFIDTLPTICHQRIEKRRREGESLLNLGYLERCHKYHTEWLQTSSIPMLKINLDSDIIYNLDDVNNEGFKLIETITKYLSDFLV